MKSPDNTTWRAESLKGLIALIREWWWCQLLYLIKANFSPTNIHNELFNASWQKYAYGTQMLSLVAIGFGYSIRKKLVVSQGPGQQKVGQAKVSLACPWPLHTLSWHPCSGSPTLPPGFLNKHIFFSQRVENFIELLFPPPHCQQNRANAHMCMKLIP